ncbi:hypothetical protein [uncultured Thiodictyon sp.]|uniref:hypothetical protein n=1 Tax=uncultured Thiodictyon sp. TaxID=1846217 RepID=UPI002600E1F0|nr:hypothetical protein [uncultured Thiodictyon sp.]
MPSSSYFPLSESERVEWLKVYAAKLAIYGQLLGLSAEEITSTLLGIANYIWAVMDWYPTIHQNTLDSTAFKALIATGTGNDPVAVPSPRPFPPPPGIIIPGLFARIFNQVQRMKLHPAYGEGIGREMGIVATATAVDYPAPEPTAILEQGPKDNHVRIDYPKHGHGGVAVECRINAGPWLLLGHFTRGTIYDKRPVAVSGTPEVREYRLCWWDKDEQSGEWSVVLTVLVGG